jgi:hypothetical protein
MISLRHIACVIFMLFTLLPSLCFAQANEERIQAVFLYNFLNYVTWPAITFAQGQSPNICIYESGELSDRLNTIRQKAAREKTTFNVHTLTDKHDKRLTQCQILFIHKSYKNDLDDIMQHSHAGLLTVSNMYDFASKDGIIEMRVTPEKTVKLIVNADKLNATDLKASSKLMRIAEVIYKDE